MKVIKCEFGKYKVYAESFVNENEMISVSKGRSVQPGVKRTEDTFRDRKVDYDDPDWRDGLKSNREACEVLAHGMKDIPDIPAISRFTAESANLYTQRRVQFYNEVHGFEVDMGLYMTGEPECMVEIQYVNDRPTFEVGVDMVVPWYAKKEAVRSAGIAMLGAILAMESMGMRTRIHIVSGNIYPYNRIVAFEYILKQEDSRLNLARALFPCASVGFLRTISFGWQSRCPIAPPKDYGHAVAFDMDANEQKRFYQEVFGLDKVFNLRRWASEIEKGTMTQAEVRDQLVKEWTNTDRR